MTELYGALGCDETAVNFLKHKKRSTSGREEDFLLVDTGQNNRQNRLVRFATVGSLEKLYKAETIYNR